MRKLTCFAFLVLSGAAGCDKAPPDYQATAASLCQDFVAETSDSGRLAMVEAFLSDYPDYAGGAFDAKTLVALIDRSLAENQEAERDPAKPGLLGDCTEFILSHWLIGEIDG